MAIVESDPQGADALSRLREAAIEARVLKLETGCRQLPAMRLYEAMGYRAIAPSGAVVGDPTSRCYEKAL